VQQDDFVALLPGPSLQLNQPLNHHNGLNGYDSGAHIDTSFPTHQNATTQDAFIPHDVLNATIQTHNARTPATNKKFYCVWPGCRQSDKEYTAAKLKFVSSNHSSPVLTLTRF